VSDNLSEYVDGCDSTTRRELHVESSIDPEVARERGYETITRPTNADQQQRERLQALNIPGWAINEDRYYPGILIPIFGPTGRVVSHQWKPRLPVPNREGKKMKYASAKGQSSRLDVHPRWSVLATDAVVPPIRDAQVPLFITEGIKKADSMTSRGLCTIGLNGVYNWRSSMGTLGDWEDVALRGRNIGIVFDADVTTNRNVRQAGNRLKRWLKSRGAAKVWFFVPPECLNGDITKPTKGVDDYFAAGASRDDFLALGAPNLPEKATDIGSFTDAVMANRYTDEVLAGHYLFSVGIGWLHWTGRRWAPTDDAVPLNAMREHAIDQYAEALRWKAQLIAERKDASVAEAAIDGWSSSQGASRLKSALGLAAGIPDLRREATEFDTDPDLLNTPDGVLDLRTMRLLPHDPERLMTRITQVGYSPAARDEAFTTVLQSISPDAVEWLQTMLGQGVTGHHSENLVMLTGVGRNGKSKLMDVLTQALGSNLPDEAGYAKIVPNTLLLTANDRSGPTPEKMTLLGLRFAYMEETPEDGHLNANMLKEIVDAPAITARQLYQKQVTFRPSHSLFLNTNHPPQVGGTDTAIWRRLLRVDFPYRFRLPNDGLGAPLDIDRAGMPNMARALATDSAQRAALAWLVEGAARWYELGDAGEPPAVPASVHAAVSRWRMDTDDVLNFLTDQFEFDPTSWVWSSSVYQAFADWSKSRGTPRPLGQKQFTARIESHTALPGMVTATRKRTTDHGRSNRPSPGGYMGSLETDPAGGRGRALVGLRWRTVDAF
jgi:P4 family phage/plasmid primase-like protien